MLSFVGNLLSHQSYCSGVLLVFFLVFSLVSSLSSGPILVGLLLSSKRKKLPQKYSVRDEQTANEQETNKVCESKGGDGEEISNTKEQCVSRSREEEAQVKD